MIAVHFTNTLLTNFFSLCMMADPITITASTFSIVAQALQLIHDVTELSQDAQNDFHGLENTIDRLSDRITCMNRQIIRRDHRDRFEHRVCKVIDLLASLEKILQDSIAISNGMSVKGGYIKALWRWKFGRASKAAWCEKEINAELECLVELQSQWYEPPSVRE